MNLYKLTKEELVARCKRLQKENDALRMELNTLSDKYIELEITTKRGEYVGKSKDFWEIDDCRRC